MSIAQIPTGTIVPEMVSSIDPRTVIPVGTILKNGTLIPEPLQEDIDTRDPNNKIGMHQAPLHSIIPDGVFLPKGTFIPVPVNPGTIFPNRTILPIGSKIPDQTSVPYGSIVAEGTELDESKLVGIMDKIYGLWKKISSARGMIKHIPLGTHIPKDTVFPVQSIIVAGTRIEYTSDNAFELAIPLGTVIYDVKSLDVVKPELKGRNSAARLPKSLVLTHPTNEQVAQAVYLPPGTVIPKFSNGEYAVIPPGTVIPLLANGAASTIPENAIITRTEKEENFIAANTVVPEGAKIPPGTVIPEGAQIPEGVVLYIPKLEDGRSAVIPPLTHIPVGAIFPEMFADKEINIPYGTTIPKSTTKTIRITPEVEVPENFQLQPSGDVKDIIVQKGTYIPKTDMLLNIPKGTVIPNNVPWTIRQTGLQTIQTFKEYLQDTQIPLKLFLAIHFFLMLYALQHVLTTPGISRSFAHLLVALFFPELYLFILFYQSRKVEQPMTGIGRVQFWAAILLVMLLGFTFILP